MRIHCHEYQVTLKPTSDFSISSPEVDLKVQKKMQKMPACYSWKLMSSTLWLSKVTLWPSSALKGPACLQCQRGSADARDLSDLDPSLMRLTHNALLVLAVSMMSTSVTVNYYFFFFFFGSSVVFQFSQHFSVLKTTCPRYHAVA